MSDTLLGLVVSFVTAFCVTYGLILLYRRLKRFQEKADYFIPYHVVNEAPRGKEKK